jgi:hypothetical protein
MSTPAEETEVIQATAGLKNACCATLEAKPFMQQQGYK